MKYRFIFFWTILAISFPAYGDVTFSSLSLNSENKVIFKAEVRSPIHGSFSSWISSDLKDNSMESLTFYPERLWYLGKTGQLQIQNRFGLFRTTPQGVKLVSRDAFVKRTPIPEGKLLPVLASQDGRWLTFLQETSLVQGDLVLYDITTDESTVIAKNLTLSFRKVPVLWSPESDFFVYEKNGQIYYYSLKQKAENRIPQENLRSLGPGLLGSLYWAPTGELFYALENLIYRIIPEEFFTRSLYGGLFRVGGVVGKLAQNFNPQSDQFWLSPDLKTVLFNLGGRSLFSAPLTTQDFYQEGNLAPLAYLSLPLGLEIQKVLWSNDGALYILTASVVGGAEATQILTFTGSVGKVLVTAKDPFVRDIFFSPDQKTLVIVQDKGLSLRNASNFTETKFIDHTGTYTALYKDASTLIIGGRTGIWEVTPANGKKKLLLAGEMEKVGFGPGNSIYGTNSGKSYVYKGAGAWEEITVPVTLSPAQTGNENFRVFLEDQSTGSYRNLVMIRTLKGLGTQALFPKPTRSYDPFPSSDSQSTDPRIFTNGSRLRARQVSIAIDARDSAEGLPALLRSLKDFGFRTTFFVNGEFLRRNPGAAQEISRSGHEAANLFYIDFDLLDPRFVIDEEYVRKGLGRQEDDYFIVTGKELTTLWHSPDFVKNNLILNAGQSGNYTFVNPDASPIPSASRSADALGLILKALEIKKPGSIIPLTLGLKDSKTGESFFTSIDLLLNALVILGYEVVPVSVLKENTAK